jgi:hypothetical protein
MTKTIIQLKNTVRKLFPKDKRCASLTDATVKRKDHKRATPSIIEKTSKVIDENIDNALL